MIFEFSDGFDAVAFYMEQMSKHDYDDDMFDYSEE